MLANIKNFIRESAVCKKCTAVLSFLFSYLHKKFLWGIFKNIDEKFFKFLFVGALNTFVSYMLYAFFVAIGMIANLALVCQYAFGIVWNFKTTGTIVFNNKNNKLIFKFFASYIFTFLINSVLLFILINNLNFDDYLAQALLILPIAMLSFFILKTWVFVDRN